jgi:glycine/D-amino acid oxidase-like deaminating enzyme
LDEGPTPKAKKELLEKLTEVVRVAVKAVPQHKVGIRPATKDRKPFLGKHPNEQSVYVFNGFGAKGVSLVPYFSERMCAFILEAIPLPKEVDISRYFKYI